MTSIVIQLFAVLPGIVFLGLGLRRVVSKVMQWGRLLTSGDPPSGYMGKRMSLMSFLTGLLSASVGVGWIVFFYYFGVGTAL